MLLDGGTSVTIGRRRTKILVGSGCLFALMITVPACSPSPSSPASLATTSSTSTSTTSSVTVPEQSPAELAACAADAQSVQMALDAFMALKGVYPTPPTPWSAATYASNYALLTTASGGGPFLHGPPGVRFYVVEYDAAGHVWIAPSGIYGPYNPGQDFAANPNVCLAAVR
jgi:guanyl-specific ribonuclease Sa